MTSRGAIRFLKSLKVSASTLAEVVALGAEGPVAVLARRQIDGIVHLLGVTDMKESKRFYVDRGLTVAKGYGSKYIEFEAPSGAVKLGLYRRAALAKDASVAPDGGGSHRIVIGSDAGSFTDPDGFVWEAA